MCFHVAKIAESCSLGAQLAGAARVFDAGSLMVCVCCLVPQVTFKPDASVFAAGASFDPDTIITRLRELSFLNAGGTSGDQARGGAQLALRCQQ